MALDTYIKSGTGKSYKAEVDKYHSLKVTNEIGELPPIGTRNKIQFWSDVIEDQNVDGSVTEQITSVSAALGYDIHITHAIILISAISLSNSKFGSLAALTNGWSLTVTESGVESFLINAAKTNGEVLLQSGLFDPFGSTSSVNVVTSWNSNNDALVAKMNLTDFIPEDALRLGRGTFDKISSKVNDDLSSLFDFQVRLFGHKHLDLEE